MRLLNGTFQKSDGLVARDRFRDISLYAPDLWASAVSDGEGKRTTVMDVKAGGPGTPAGVSTKLRRLVEAWIQRYLQHDGILTLLQAKKQELNKTSTRH